MPMNAIWLFQPEKAWTGPRTGLRLPSMRPGPLGSSTAPDCMSSFQKARPDLNHKLPCQGMAVRQLSLSGVISRPGYRSLVEPSPFRVNSEPSALNTTSRLTVWRMAVMGTLGVPIRMGPDQLPATLGSFWQLRMVLLVGSAAHSWDPRTCRNCGLKPLGRAQAVQAVPLYSYSWPSLQATYSPSTGLA